MRAVALWPKNEGIVVVSLEDQKRCFGWCRKINQDGASVVLSNKTDGVFFERMVQGEREHIKYFDFYHTSGRGLKKAIEMIIVFD